MTKTTAMQWLSRYARLRDGIGYCKTHGIDIRQFIRWLDLPCKCCTCNVIRTLRQMDAGHFIGRGSGGGSGVYLDERNVNAQCRRDNGFEQGAHIAYRQFIIDKYGQEGLDDLEFRHKNHFYRVQEIIGLELYYKQKFEEMCREHNLR